MLHDKESGPILKILLRPQQFKLIVSNQQRQSLVHLKQGEILSDTCHTLAHVPTSILQNDKLTKMTSPSKLEHVSLHFLRIALQPPLRSINLRMRPENSFIPMQHPRIHSDSCASRQAPAGNFCALRRHEARDVQTYGWAQAHCFFQAGLEVRQSLRLVPLWESAEVACGSCLVQFFLEAGVNDRIAEDMIAE